jgi:hypothetical protein
MSETVTLEEIIDSVVTEETYSPYKSIKTTNKVFVELGFEKVLPPQMGYNYNRVGMLGVKGSNIVTKDELKTWIVKYITKNLTK